MTLIHRGAWLLPISHPPIADGWVAVDDGFIVAVGGPHNPLPAGAEENHSPDARSAVGGAVAILPGLVNAHVHLELSWMRSQVPPDQSMASWAGKLLALRRGAGGDSLPPIVDAVRETRASGTALVGDVTNSLASYEALAQSELSAAVFREVIGFAIDDAGGVIREVQAQLSQLTAIGRLRPSIVPHAPYSVSPELFVAIAAAGDRPISVHVGESAEEIEFLRTGDGPWRSLLEELGAWRASWSPPSCGPVEYLDRFGLVNSRLLAVHGVQLTGTELARLRSARATVVTCPRSNQWTGAGAPPIDRFYHSGVRVAIGTDSLASVEDLNMFNELAEVRRLAPLVSANRILASATLSGAEALGFANELGTIEPGKRAELIAVRVPANVPDVEEYLVGGIEPTEIRWLDRD
jgi:aminodeoxyfutalosine deaminase